jgi:hypothetical protein
MMTSPSRWHAWAAALQDAVAGLGTDEAAIVRVLTCCHGAASPGPARDSIDKLKQAYEEVAGQPLAEMLRSELSFSFRSAVLKFVG